jgi:voltage-gated potassium channel Kch
VDVTAKITSLRDFFLTLFFVAIGMTIPAPTEYYLAWAFAISGFVIFSRLLTVFWPLHFMRQGQRASFLPALNLCQISEFSLVILALGFASRHITDTSRGVAAYTFVILAILSTYGILKSDGIFRLTGRRLKALKVKDLDDVPEIQPEPRIKSSVFLLGFSWTASSLVEEITRTERNLLPELAVIDFNPQVNQELRRREIRVIYGDISQRDTLEHAGIGEAKVVICSLSNSVLKGTSNQKLVQMVRELSPAARIIVHSELLSEIPQLYAAGASYVCSSRLVEAKELLHVLLAARQNLLDEKRAALEQELQNRREVIP